jgi:hypothetical protein
MCCSDEYKRADGVRVDGLLNCARSASRYEHSTSPHARSVDCNPATIWRELVHKSGKYLGTIAPSTQQHVILTETWESLRKRYEGAKANINFLIYSVITEVLDMKCHSARKGRTDGQISIIGMHQQMHRHRERQCIH